MPSSLLFVIAYYSMAAASGGSIVAMRSMRLVVAAVGGGGGTAPRRRIAGARTAPPPPQPSSLSSSRRTTAVGGCGVGVGGGGGASFVGAVAAPFPRHHRRRILAGGVGPATTTTAADDARRNGVECLPEAMSAYGDSAIMAPRDDYDDDDDDDDGDDAEKYPETTMMSSTAGRPRAEDRHYLCYLLRSKVRPPAGDRTYIGITTDPPRRIRQHNGELASGGARRTRGHRPWEYIAAVGTFENRADAMRFEWHWQVRTSRGILVCESSGSVFSPGVLFFLLRYTLRYSSHIIILALYN